MPQYLSLSRNAGPSVEPVTVAEAKSHLRVDTSDDDTYIGTLITAAREWVEAYLDRTLVHTQWRMRLERFPTDSQYPIELPRPPVVSSGTATAVTITYTPSAGASTVTLDATEYRVDRQATPGVCRPLYGQTWPSHLVDQNSTTVTWWAGYSSDGTSVPAPVKSAILMLVAHLWRNREMTAEAALSEVPMGTKALLDTIRWGSYR